MPRIMKALAAACLLAAPLCDVAHAAMSQTMMEITSGAHLQNWIHRRSHQHKKSLSKLMHNMTLTHAMELLHKKHGHESHKHRLSMVQAALQHRRHDHVTKKRSNLRAKQLHAAVPAPSVPAAVKEAVDEINKMIFENQEKYDLELHKCCEYNEVQSALIETSHQDVALFNTKSGGCRQDMLTADYDMDLSEKKLPELDESLKYTEGECNAEKTELHAQLTIIKGDLTVMSKILKMVTKCEGKVLLQRCQLDSSLSLEDSCNSFMALKSKNGEQHEELQAAMQQLRSEASKDLVNDHLSELMEREQEQEEEETAWPTTAAPATTTAWRPNELPEMTVKRRKPCKEPFASDKRTNKCAVGGPDCKKLAEKFIYIEAGIGDKKEEIEEQLAELEHHCEFALDNIEAQIHDHEFRLKDAQVRLAVATKCENEATENSRLKSQQLESLDTDFAKMTETCHRNYQGLESEACGLKKVRGEVVKLESTDNPAFFQDCVVSEWVAGECSVSCGGGMRSLTREVTTPQSVGGAACPVLTGVEECNKQKCPVDCVLGDWSGWSQCTAKCGGGVTQKQRLIVTEPMHGGEPCGETTQATSCGVESCDKDCVLHGWTAWSECSKECDGGVETRYRHIYQQAVGGGQCEDPDSETRLAYKPCNNFACKKAAATLICRDKLDVVLLIDGSGSIGKKGWDASLVAAKYIVDAFKGDAKSDNMISVLLFSTNIEIITHFTNKFDDVKTKIDGMTWPSSYTKTGKALDTARTEMELGRQESNSIAIVLTDGRPMSTRYTGKAAKKLRKIARLLWVPVTKWAPLADIREWASKPKKDNIVPMKSFKQLEEPSSIDEIVADSCKHVH